MLSETLSEGLDAYRIGPRIRELRLAKGLGLAQLGEHTGLSAGMLSKLETGQVYPTLPTLLRIALVFGVGLDRFFTEPEEQPQAVIVRRGDRVRMPDTPDGPAAYVFESLDYPATDRDFECFLAEFTAADRASEPHAHKGKEMIYILTGKLRLTHAGKEHELRAGDAITFDASHDHSYRRVAPGNCQALIVASPNWAEPI